MSSKVEHLIEKLMIKYDKDNNQVLDKKEIVIFMSDEYARNGKKPANISEAEQFIKEYDTNQDGVLSRTELRQLFSEM